MRLLPPEDLVDGQKEGVVEHTREKFLEDGRRLLDAGIGIDLYQPRSALFIQHEIVAEDLEAVVALLLVELLSDTEGGDLHNGLDHVDQLLITLAAVGQQSLQILKGQLVSQFVLPVVFVEFLNCIVGEVDIEISHAVGSE